MDKAELDDIRAKVALEPEGSLARLLLEELDRVHARMEEAGTAYARASLKNHHHLTNEEADKVMVLFARGETPDMETGRCRACKGKGYAETIGCFGSNRNGDCPKCHGRGTTYRIKVPE